MEKIRIRITGRTSRIRNTASMSVYSFSAGRYGAPTQDEVRWPLAGRYHGGRYKGGRRGHNRCGQEEATPRETDPRSHR
jgi:hypothetical protein